MDRQQFQIIVLLVSVALLTLITLGGPGPDGQARLPLLLLMLASELGAILNAISVYAGLPVLRERPLPRRPLLRLAAHLLLVVVFVLNLVDLWPG
jgi:hypothetical protein